jgi:hypothetical protein
MDETPTHRRTITIDCVERDETMVVTGVLVDERPWADDEDVRTLHRMELTFTVDQSTMEITDAQAAMGAHPHEECPTITPAFRSLIGLSVNRGFNRAVQERVGRQRGCSHLEFLARAMGPATVQSVASAARRRGQRFVSEGESRTSSAWLVNTCHLFGAGGIGLEKMRRGWQPGQNRYPTPSLVTLRRLDREADRPAD